MLSFEPNPDGLRRLRRHFEANELADRIETLPCALSDGEGAMMLWDITEVTGRSPLSEVPREQRSVWCPARTTCRRDRRARADRTRTRARSEDPRS